MGKKTVILSAFFFCCLTSVGAPCPQCGVSMLEGDNFCQNCGTPRKMMEDRRQENQEYSNFIQPTSSGPQEEWRQTRYGNRAESGPSDGVGERLLGMGRGLSTITLSPLNVFRGLTTSFNWLVQSYDSQKSDSFNLGHLGAVGAIIAGGVVSIYAAVGVTFGSVTTCADVVNGSIDMVTIGYYGDWLYDSKGSGKPTPWVWERKWNTSAVPWINRE